MMWFVTKILGSICFLDTDRQKKLNLLIEPIWPRSSNKIKRFVYKTQLYFYYRKYIPLSTVFLVKHIFGISIKGHVDGISLKEHIFGISLKGHEYGISLKGHLDGNSLKGHVDGISIKGHV